MTWSTWFVWLVFVLIIVVFLTTGIPIMLPAVVETEKVILNSEVLL